MPLSNKVLPYSIIAILLVILFFFFRSDKRKQEIIYGQESYRAMQADTIEIYRDKEDKWTSEKKGAEITQDNYDALLKENSDLKRQVKGFKNVTAIINTTTTTRIDTVVLSFRDSIPCDFGVRDFSVDSIWYSISGKVTNKYAVLDEVLITDSQGIVIGEKYMGLFKPTEFTVKVRHSNPYIFTTGAESLVIKPKKHWYDNKLIYLGFGAVVGGYAVLSATK